jgi:hypothetical protein
MSGEHKHDDLAKVIADLTLRVTKLETPPVKYGVPTGVTLTPLTAARAGDVLTADRLVINTPNAVYDLVQFNHLVEVRAPGVKFTRCLFKGITWAIGDRALLFVNPAKQTIGQPSATVEDCTFDPVFPNVSIDGFRGSNYTVRRCDISKTVDGAVIHGVGDNRADPTAGNVVFEDNWVHDLTWYANDGYHTDGSHNDGIQLVGGSHVQIRRNFFDSPRNACLMIQANLQPVADVIIENNRFIGGAASINIYDKREPVGFSGIVIKNNSFAKLWVPPVPGQETPRANYPILITVNTAAIATVTGNVWADGSTPGPVVKTG